MWHPMDPILLSRSLEENDLTCVALGSVGFPRCVISCLDIPNANALISTGMRCLPEFKAQKATGLILHDWHAEVVTFRCFNHFLLQECHRLVQCPDYDSPFIHRKEPDATLKNVDLQQFTMHDNLQIHLYCSEAPCGDASMELVMNTQADPTPWPVVEKPVSQTSRSSLKGRANFSELGIVRRKPCTERGDLPTQR